MNNLLNNPEHTESKQRLTLARQHLIKAFAPLLSTQHIGKQRWIGTKTDLLEMVHLAYTFSYVRDDRHFSVDGATRLRQLFALHAPKPQCFCGQSHATKKH